jgi:SP family arabinose:H+ symporter-like MFS transporter
MSSTLGIFSNVGAATVTTTGRHPLRYTTFVCVCAALGGLLFGFDIAVISGTIPALRRQFGLDQWLEGILVASALIGCMLGSAAAGPVSDRVGRKNALMIASFLFIVTGLGCAFAPDRISLLSFRFIGGVGIGVASMVCPLYISEISPAGVRGRMVTLFQFAIAIGICASLLSNVALEWLSRHSPPAANHGLYQWMFVDQVWRAMFLATTLPAALFALATLFIPESPRWLVMVGRERRAREVLELIQGKDTAEESLRDIRVTIGAETGRFSDLFSTRWRKALGIAVFLALVSEFSGITVVLYYGPDILNRAGVRLSDALGGFVIIGVVKMLFTVVALWLIDRAGRRPLLFWGTLGCCMALASLGMLFALHWTSGPVLVALICMFCASFAFSIGPIKWVIMSEIFPTQIRGRAVAVATTAVWLADAVVNYLFPWARETWGAALCFFVFAAVLLPQIFFARFMMPETKGRTLEEIERFDLVPVKP